MKVYALYLLDRLISIYEKKEDAEADGIKHEAHKLGYISITEIEVVPRQKPYALLKNEKTGEMIFSNGYEVNQGFQSFTENPEKTIDIPKRGYGWVKTTFVPGSPPVTCPDCGSDYIVSLESKETGILSVCQICLDRIPEEKLIGYESKNNTVYYYGHDGKPTRMNK